MSRQNQPLQGEELKARPYRAANRNVATQYLLLTAEPGPILAQKVSTGTEDGIPIPLFFEEPSRLNDESPSKYNAGQSGRPKSLHPFILSIIAFKHGRKFSKTTSAHRKRRLSSAAEKEGQFSPALTRLYLGISATFSNDQTELIALAINDDYVVKEVEDYEHENFAKFIGAELPTKLGRISKTLCSRLWLDLDIVPIVVLAEREDKGEEDRKGKKNFCNVKRVDEQADSMVRKCVMHFGPSQTPLLQVGFRGFVQTDVGFRAYLTTLQNYRDTCGTSTWETMMAYAEKLRRNKIRIACFSSTPQGGGVALMRHALVRFARRIGVDLSWYVPKPLPTALRITKNIHKVLQGVGPPSQRITAEEKKAVIHWITDNAYRYWLSESGPLRPVEEGGSHVIIPARKYIIQIARFDLSKGIPTVIDSYAEFRRQCEVADIEDTPQIVLCGNQSVDDPDSSIVYDQMLDQIMSICTELIKDISVMRLDANAQLLNTLISKAHVVLQLSTSEGLEVKVSETLHAGRPVVATKAGGMPLQVKDSINGFLVEPGDWKAVAHHLMNLFTNDDLYERMSDAARAGVSDEVGTVSNALCWFYLASKWTDLRSEKYGKAALQPNERWVYDMAREEANCPYSADEKRLPRVYIEVKNTDSLGSGSLS
ncbi:Trehalose phosphorylase [Fusarium oxysporum f. sp. rapae]|uniref:Trehalose phosphorylase n=1 Tax=Fusarium oxysporum f. sp. rapae TaxID=485398 RepID=A0A8J5NJA8_FUSOX|nr:Trehalose phosphorylase [Fusarium oxysporum f. sp. rapae]